MTHSNPDLPSIVARNVTLALATEPLGEKHGCTTRSNDSSPNAKLQHFIVAAINIQEAFRQLAQDQLRAGHQPPSIFKYAFEAQASSVWNRRGSKVSFGQTLLLIPLVSAHLNSIIGGHAFERVEAVFDYTLPTLEACTMKDIADLEKFCQISIEQSKLSNKENNKARTFPDPRFIGKFDTFLEVIEEQAFGKLSISKEVFNGFPITRQLLEQWDASEEKNLIAFTESIFPWLMERMGRPDIAADLIGAAMYLIISSSKENRIF